MTYISKFTKIDDSKKTATIKKLFVGITDRDELYFLEVGDRGSQDFTITGDTVMKVSESSAEEYTKDRIRYYFEMDEGLSNINVLNYLDDSAESFFDDYQEESNRNYAEDIAGESADGYPNRLAEELVERGIVDEEDAQKDDFDAEDYIDEFVEDMNNQEDSIEWYRFNFGEEEFAEVVRNNNLIDIDEVVDDVDWYDWFDNSTLTDEVLSDDGETFLFEALGGGQNRDELDDLKITFLPESFIYQLKKNWDKYHLKQLPKSEFFPEVEQDEQGILDFYVNEALDVYEAGGTLPTPFGQAGLVGETGAMNEMELFAMGGGLPQGVHQYYANTYNPAYPTSHGYAKGGEITSKMYDPEIHYQVVVNDNYDSPLYFKTFASAKKYTLANVKNQDNTIISPQGDTIEVEKNQSKKDLDFLFEYSMAKGGRLIYRDFDEFEKVAKVGDKFTLTYQPTNPLIKKPEYEITNKKSDGSIVVKTVGSKSQKRYSIPANYYDSPVVVFAKGGINKTSNTINKFGLLSFSDIDKVFGVDLFELSENEQEQELDALREEWENMQEDERKSILEDFGYDEEFAKGGKLKDLQGKKVRSVQIGNDIVTKKPDEVDITFDDGSFLAIYHTKNGMFIDFYDKDGRTRLKKEYAKGGATSSDTSDVYFFAYEEFMKNGKKFKSEKELYDFVNDGYSFPKYSKKSVKSAFKTLNKEMYAKGGKTQGYNDKLDESLGNTKGKRSTKKQNYKDRRNESEAMEKKGGKRKYARVKTMDKGNRKKRKTPMTLAKAIRRDGEKWQDAVKRATIMMKKDK